MLTSGMHPNGEMLSLGTRSPCVAVRYVHPALQLRVSIYGLERHLDPSLGALLFTAAQIGDGLNMYAPKSIMEGTKLT